MEITQYSKTGKYHSLNQKCNEDVIRIAEIDGSILLVLADGVTACENSKRGAELACEAVQDFVVKERQQIFVFPEEKVRYLLLEHVCRYLEKEIQKYAGEVDKKQHTKELFHSYASTLTAVCMEEKTGETLLFNLGDSMIYETEENGCRPVLRPNREQGQICAITTKEAYRFAELKRKRTAMGGGVFLCSDGFWKLIEHEESFGGQWKQYIAKNDFEGLNELLETIDNPDDCSYIYYERDL